MAAHNCEDQQWLCMYVGNQLWLHLYVWGSTVATNYVGDQRWPHMCSSMVVANINYVLSTLA